MTQVNLNNGNLRLQFTQLELPSCTAGPHWNQIRGWIVSLASEGLVWLAL